MASAVLVSKCGCLFLPNHFMRSSSQICRHASVDVAHQISHPTISSEPTQLKRGTGGRSSFSGKVVTVFGGNGFLGRFVINQLGKTGSQVIVPYRGDIHFTKQLKLCGDLGQILFQPFFLKDEESLYKSMKFSNVVINLIGRDHETKNFPFEEVHVKGPRNIARIARESGVEHLIHVSALNACENPTPVIFKKGSQFLASKWRGEQAVREEFPNAVIFRPSDIFGIGDSYMFYYASTWRHSLQSIALWKKGAGILKQPAFAMDVAKGILKATLNPNCAGQTYQAVGPHRYELAELIDWFHRVMMKSQGRMYYRLDLRFDPILWTKLLLSELIFKRVRTLSYERLERDHVTDTIDDHLPTLLDLGVELTPLEDRIFFILKRFRAHAYRDPLLLDYLRDVEPAPSLKMSK